MKRYCCLLLVQMLLLLHAHHFVLVGSTEPGSQSGQQAEMSPPDPDANSSWESPGSTRGFALALQHLVHAKERVSRDFEGLVASINSTLSVFRRWEDNWERQLPQLIKSAIFSSGNSSVSDKEVGALFS